MKKGLNTVEDIKLLRPTYIQQLPKRKAVKDRKKIRQLLRSMLAMEDEQRLPHGWGMLYAKS